jgi:hypothetical protein
MHTGPPPSERQSAHPRPPIRRTRRRWPILYEGQGEREPIVDRRFRRSNGEQARERIRRSVRGGTWSALRQNPVRNGLIGLAVAGTAAPVAVNRYQQGLRTDPSHEANVANPMAGVAGSDEGVQEMWQEMESEESRTASEREQVIASNLERYASFGLTPELAAEIYDAAAEQSIDPEIAFGLVRAESSFKNSSTSPVGAVGLTQLMPRTASWLEPGVTRAQLRESQTNLRIGFKYLRSMIDKYDGDTRLALLAYNRGPGTVDRELRNGRNPDNGYVDFVAGKKDHGHKLYTRR